MTTLPEKPLCKTLEYARRRKVGMIFWQAFWDFATAFSCWLALFVAALLLLEKKGLWEREGHFWLPEMLASLLFAWAFLYAIAATIRQFPSLFQIATEVDKRQNLADLFSTAYCFSTKKERPPMAEIAIEKAQETPVCPAFLYPIHLGNTRIAIFLVLILMLALWSFGQKAPSQKEQEKQGPSLMAQSEKQEKKKPKEQPPAQKKNPKQEPKPQKTDDKRPQQKKNDNSGAGQKENYIPETMQPLFGEGPKWLRLGTERQSAPQGKNPSQEKLPPMRPRFSPQKAAQQARSSNLSPEHRKAIEKYFSLLRPE